MDETNPEDFPNKALDEDKRPKKRYDDTQGDTIFIRNVSRYDTDEEGLKKFMEENFGETVYCLICKEKDTGESRGTAFVKFKDPATASQCLEEFKDRELQYKFFLDGRNLFVLPALTRDEANEVRESSTKKIKLEEKKKKKKKPRHLPREKFFPSKKPAQENSLKPIKSSKNSKKDLKNSKQNKNRTSTTAVTKKKKVLTNGHKPKTKASGNKDKSKSKPKKRWRHNSNKVAKT